MPISTCQFIVSVFATVSLFSCNHNSEPVATSLDGYGGLILGSTLEEALVIASPRDFNTYGLRECLQEMPVKGCFLSPANQFTTFKRVNGIPYGLQLEFNKLGALTDIKLRYSRGIYYDENLDPIKATITKAECADILERTIDWVAQAYGPLERGQRREAKFAKTKVGNLYWIDTTSNKQGFNSLGEINFDKGRMVTVYSHYLLLGEFGPDCNIDVSFEEPDTVERRPANP